MTILDSSGKSWDLKRHIQDPAKEWSLGCVNSRGARISLNLGTTLLPGLVTVRNELTKKNPRARASKDLYALSKPPIPGPRERPLPWPQQDIPLN